MPLMFWHWFLFAWIVFAAALVTSPCSAADVLLSAAVCAAAASRLSSPVACGCFSWWRSVFSVVARLPSSLPSSAAVALCLFVMAESMGSPKDAGLDAGNASKAENVVTSIRLTKDNYLSWSAALEIGITSRGRLSYITSDKPAPLKSDPQWATWALEDRQVKVWIISSVSSNIQPLILRKLTSFDMWTVLAKMYGRKKRHLRTYQIKRSIYSLTQGDLSVAAFYAALKTKWEELDYHVTDEWKCGSDHSLYWENEWMDRTFLFLGGLRDEFESIRSQILNGDEIPGIEEVYARVESEEQRRQVMHLTTGNAPSAFVSRASRTVQRPARRCTHCNKLGHSVDFCWDIHPEKRLVRGRPPSGRRSPSVSDSNQSTPSSGAKTKLSPDQLKELQAYIGRLSTTPKESSTPSVFDTVSNEKDSQMERVTATAGDHLFGQVYVRKEKATVEDVVDEDRTNHNPAISLDDPSPSNEELPIALRKGTKSFNHWLLRRIPKYQYSIDGLYLSPSLRAKFSPITSLLPSALPNYLQLFESSPSFLPTKQPPFSASLTNMVTLLLPSLANPPIYHG
ncbi:hypothetical protein EJ110_NYTH49941 [Nymphaea thermarum]|nr:hypothetical protein EJ110_NYTH49941 [Nymphaea thermarum]